MDNSALPHSPFQYASGADIIRASQKDQYYAATLAAKMDTVLRQALGSRSLMTWSAELRTAASFLYLALTTLVGQRTLGEEYCDLTYITASEKSLPSSRRRAFFVSSSALLPYILSKAWPKVHKRIRKSCRERPDVTAWLDRISPVVTLSNLETIHLALFYFTGAYYTLSRRFAGLRYIFVRKIDESSERIGYEVLGFLMLARLCIPLFSTILTEKADAYRIEESNNALNLDLENMSIMPFLNDDARKCTLCLSLMQTPTATTCGHLFCWNCISEWTRTKVRLKKW